MAAALVLWSREARIRPARRRKLVLGRSIDPDIRRGARELPGDRERDCLVLKGQRLTREWEQAAPKWSTGGRPRFTELHYNAL